MIAVGKKREVIFVPVEVSIEEESAMETNFKNVENAPCGDVVPCTLVQMSELSELCHTSNWVDTQAKSGMAYSTKH